MKQTESALTVSPQRIDGGQRWHPVTGAAVQGGDRFDWTQPARLIILAAAALIAYMALAWQTGVYENAALNAEEILVTTSESQPIAVPLLATIAPSELVVSETTVQPPAVTADPPLLSFHVVQPGESLAELADRYSISVDRLLTANPNIVDPDLIRAGDTIMVP